MSIRGQIRSHEAKSLIMAANRGELADGGEVEDLLMQIRDLVVALDVAEGKLRKERSVTRKLRKQVKDLS